MKKIIIPILSLGVLLSSCGSDDGGSSSDKKIEEFSSTEESKEALEENAIAVLDKIEEFNDDSALDQIIELAEYLNENSDSESDTEDEILNTALKNISSLAAKELDLAEFNAAQVDVAPNTLEDDFNEDAGVYAWSDDEGDFIKTGESDDLIYNIAYNSKNAVFSVTEFKTASYADGEEFPTSVKSNLIIDGITVFEQSHTASITTDKYVPNSFTSTIEIGELNLTSTLDNSSNTSVTQSISFKIGDSNVMSLGTTTKGNFNDFENNFEDVLSTTSLTMSFLETSVLFNGKIPSSFNSETEYTIEEQIELLNDNIDIVLLTDSKLVAIGEFYIEYYTDETTFTNPETGESTTYVEDTEDINIRFKFPDNSTADFDTYFNDNYGAVEDKLESVFDLFSDRADEAGI